MNAVLEKKTTQINSKSEVGGSNSWYSEDELNNQLIVAYTRGKEHFEKEMNKEYKARLASAKIVAENVYTNLRKNKVLWKEVKLRLTNSMEFEAIFIIPEKDYLSINEYKKSYLIANEVISIMENNCKNFSFFFMPKTKSLNQEALSGDGFNWTFKTVRRPNK